MNHPAVGTLTVYSSHSPAAVEETANPPPASVVLSMSTAAVRYFPPRFDAVVSLNATPYPPLSKSSAWIVPGIVIGVPENGDCPGSVSVVADAVLLYAESPAAFVARTR